MIQLVDQVVHLLLDEQFVVVFAQDEDMVEKLLDVRLQVFTGLKLMMKLLMAYLKKSMEECRNFDAKSLFCRFYNSQTNLGKSNQGPIRQN